VEIKGVGVESWENLFRVCLGDGLEDLWESRRAFHFVIAWIVLSMMAGCGNEIRISTRFVEAILFDDFGRKKMQ
jgi:hypothetical protein